MAAGKEPAQAALPFDASDAAHGGPTLKQATVNADVVTINAQNQLERAGYYYNQVENLHTATIAAAVLSHTANYHSAQAKILRSASQTLV